LWWSQAEAIKLRATLDELKFEYAKEEIDRSQYDVLNAQILRMQAYEAVALSETSYME
jgi:hypothetical protein